jgi:hypothetical protein
MPELIEGVSYDFMDGKILKSKFAFYFDYSSAPHVRIKTKSVDDSSFIAVQKYQQEMKYNPSMEIQQYCRVNGISQDLPNPGTWRVAL